MPGTGNSTGPGRPLGDDFQRLTAYLAAHGTEIGIQAGRHGLFAAFGAAASALTIVQDSAQRAISAAALYYGSAGSTVTTFRSDVPVLFVRAGQDYAWMNAAVDRFIGLALSQNAPVSVINYPAGHHGFETSEDTEATRQVIAQTIDYTKRALAR